MEAVLNKLGKHFPSLLAPLFFSSLMVSFFLKLFFPCVAFNRILIPYMTTSRQRVYFACQTEPDFRTARVALYDSQFRIILPYTVLWSRPFHLNLKHAILASLPLGRSLVTPALIFILIGRGSVLPVLNYWFVPIPGRNFQAPSTRNLYSESQKKTHQSRVKNSIQDGGSECKR